jgi:hypothetical protein
VFLEGGLEEWMFPGLLAARVELLDGIILSSVQLNPLSARNTRTAPLTSFVCEQTRMSTTPNNPLHQDLPRRLCSTGHTTPLYLGVFFFLIRTNLVKRLRVSLCSDIVI